MVRRSGETILPRVDCHGSVVSFDPVLNAGAGVIVWCYHGTLMMAGRMRANWLNENKGRFSPHITDNISVAGSSGARRGTVGGKLAREVL